MVGMALLWVADVAAGPWRISSWPSLKGTQPETRRELRTCMGGRAVPSHFPGLIRGKYLAVQRKRQEEVARAAGGELTGEPAV